MGLGHFLTYDIEHVNIGMYFYLCIQYLFIVHYSLVALQLVFLSMTKSYLYTILIHSVQSSAWSSYQVPNHDIFICIQ